MSTPDTSRDNLKLAVGVIILTVLALSLGDALIKSLSSGMVLWQIFVLRSLIVVPVLLVILRTRYPKVPVIPSAIGWTALRSLMLTFMWIAYYAALPNIQLSVAAAAFYTLPIFITLFSSVLVGETVRPSGWIAVAIGFFGTNLILKPATEAFNAYALLPLASAMFYALAMILTRTKCRDEHPVVLSGALNITFILAGLMATLAGPVVAPYLFDGTFLSPQWVKMGQAELVAIGILAVSILTGSVGAAIAYQSGPSSVVATFDFAYVGFAVIWGLAFFGETPDPIAVVGMALIVVAGVMAIRS